MRKTGKKLVAVIAAVSMTISMAPSSGHATVRSISMQQAKASERSEAVQGVVKQKAKDDTAAAEVTFSKASGTYGDAFQLELSGTEGDTALYYTTDGSDPSDLDNKNRILYQDGGIAIADRSNDENVLSAIDPVLFDSVNVTASKDGKNFESTVQKPSKEAVDKCTVIKAAAQHADGTYSTVFTNTYFVGDMAEHIDGISESCEAAGKNLAVMSISMDADDLFDSTKGIYVKGDTFENALKEYLAAGKTINDWNASDTCRGLDANYKQKGRDWERKTHIDYFESDGTKTKCKLQQDCGIRIQGNYSRSDYQKSFRLYARDEYGKKNFKYDFWDNAVDDQGNVIDKHKKIVLRNGGNCAFTTKFSDSYWQSLLQEIDCDNQSARPCVVYLNGEYWGVYILQDDFCGAFMENKHGVNKDNVVIYKGDAEAIQPLGYKLDEGDLPEGVTDEDYYLKDLENFMSTHKDVRDQKDYDELAAMVDEDSIIDYFATEVWINNKWDWPGKNWSMWKSTVTDETNPYADGKWRFMVYDVEFGGISGSDDKRGNAIKDSKLLQTGTADPDSVNHDKPHVRCFALMMTNEAFREKFIARLESFSTGMFEYNRAIERADLFQGVYQPILQQFFDRFPTNSGMTADKAVNGDGGNAYGTLKAIRNFLNGRDKQVTKISSYIRKQYTADSTPAPKPTDTAAPTASAEVTETPVLPTGIPSAAPVQPSVAPVQTTAPSETPKNTSVKKEKMADGTIVIKETDEAGKAVSTKYETKTGIYLLKSDNTLCYQKENQTALKNQTSVVIRDVEKINGKSLRVSEIEKGTFQGLSKLKKITIGKNVVAIGQNAFRGCSSLKKITIRSVRLKTVGKNAIRGVHKKVQIICPKGKKKAYQKLFVKKTGFAKKTMTIK